MTVCVLSELIILIRMLIAKQEVLGSISSHGRISVLCARCLHLLSRKEMNEGRTGAELVLLLKFAHYCAAWPMGHGRRSVIPGISVVCDALVISMRSSSEKYPNPSFGRLDCHCWFQCHITWLLLRLPYQWMALLFILAYSFDAYFMS